MRALSLHAMALHRQLAWARRCLPLPQRANAARGLSTGAQPGHSAWEYCYNWTGELRPHPRSPTVDPPLNIPPPNFAQEGQPRPPLSEEELALLKTSGRIAADILDQACAAVAVGVTTEEIDAAAHAACVVHGAFPTGLGFRGFPKSCCTSVNEVVCHGIPDSRPLQEGDILTIDCVAFKDGLHGDNARTVIVGRADPESEALALVAKESVEAAIRVVGPGVPYRELSNAIFQLAEQEGLSVIREYGGHGIGKSLHMPPVISFHPDHMSPDWIMEVGHTFTIEPMLALGSNDISMWGDGWTIVTDDGSRAAQYEHMVLVTENGAEVLTRTDACDQLIYGA